MIRKILLTNDDGIDAPGLASLATVLGGEYEVHVLAPDQERSGVGHGFTLYTPLRCDEVPGRFPSDLVKRAWKCSGLPVDCVKLALLTLMADEPPDLVVSGVNRGANLAVDTIYSGTVAAAREAMIIGRPSVAVSLVSQSRDTATHGHFLAAASFVRDYITAHSDQLERMEGYFLNINVPAIPGDELKGHRYTCLARTRYDDGYQVHKDPAGRPYYWIEGSLVVQDLAEDTDVITVRDGYVSVTPLASEYTDKSVLERLRVSD